MNHPNHTSDWSRILAQSHGRHQELIHQDQGDGDRQQHDSAMDIPRLAMFMDVHGCLSWFIMVYHGLSNFFRKWSSFEGWKSDPFPQNRLSLRGKRKMFGGSRLDMKKQNIDASTSIVHTRMLMMSSPKKSGNPNRSWQHPGYWARLVCCTPRC